MLTLLLLIALTASTLAQTPSEETETQMEMDEEAAAKLQECCNNFCRKDLEENQNYRVSRRRAYLCVALTSLRSSCAAAQPSKFNPACVLSCTPLAASDDASAEGEDALECEAECADFAAIEKKGREATADSKLSEEEAICESIERGTRESAFLDFFFFFFFFFGFYRFFFFCGGTHACGWFWCAAALCACVHAIGLATLYRHWLAATSPHDYYAPHRPGGGYERHRHPHRRLFRLFCLCDLEGDQGAFFFLCFVVVDCGAFAFQVVDLNLMGLPRRWFTHTLVWFFVLFCSLSGGLRFSDVLLMPIIQEANQ